MLAAEAVAGWVAAVQVPKCSQRTVGNELQIPAGRDVVEALNRSFLGEHSLDLGGIDRIIRMLAIAGHHAS